MCKKVTPISTWVPNQMGYSVGVNDEGSTVLKMGDTGMITTMTMNEVAVIQMIRLLAATLDSFDVDIKRVEE